MVSGTRIASPVSLRPPIPPAPLPRSSGVRKWLRGDKPVDQIRIPPFKH